MKEYNIPANQKEGFKSELEYIASEWFKSLKIAVLYEPQTFQTKLGQYTPDFLCEETGQYVECKPSSEFANKKLYCQFVLEQKKDLVLLTPKGVGCIEYANEWQEGKKVIEACDESNTTNIILCSKCGLKSFSTSEGVYHCRACGTHEGDHDCQNANEEPWSFSSFYDSMKHRKKIFETAKYQR